eukprot:Skav234378  [mRNA]  locus=scaffold2071:208002:208400:- [translate_table: standard]
MTGRGQTLLRAPAFLEQLRPLRAVEWQQGLSDPAIDALSRLLQFDPGLRISAREALGLEYFEPHPEAEVDDADVCKKGIDWSFDAVEPSKASLSLDAVQARHSRLLSRKSNAAHLAARSRRFKGEQSQPCDS